MSWGRCHFWRGIVDLHEGIVHFWRGINNFAWGIVVVAWGIVDIEKGIVVVEESPFHSAEGADKPAELAKNKGFAGLGFDGPQKELPGFYNVSASAWYGWREHRRIVACPTNCRASTSWKRRPRFSAA
jgi:hypothetical protein